MMRLFSSSNNDPQQDTKTHGKKRPHRPRIRPLYQVVLIGPDEVILRTGVWSGSSFVFKDRKQTGLLGRIMQMLNGQHTLEEIIKSVGSGREKEVLTVIDTLMANALAEDTPDEPEGVSIGDDDGSQPAHAFLSAIARQPISVTAGRLRAATVAVLGCGAIGMRVALQLAQSGLNQIICLDDTPFRPADVSLTPYLPSHLLGRSRAEVAAAWLSNIKPDIKVKTVSTDDDPEAAWTKILPDCTLVIVAQDAPDPLLYQRWNATALRHNVPWLLVTVDGLEGLVGPLFVPHQTACYVCFEMRLESNLLHYEAYQRGKQAAARLRADYGVRFVGLPGFVDVVAGFAATESVRLIATEYSFVAGKIMRINFQGGVVEINEVLKLPRCPACGRAAHRHPPQQAFHTFNRVITELGI